MCGRVPAYRCAEDLFEAARSAAAELSAIARHMDALRSRTGLAAASVAAGVSGTPGDPCGTDASVAAMDYERRMAPRVAENRALLSLACSLLYGDGGGGAAALVGYAKADAVWWRYVDARPWCEVAEAVGTSKPTAMRWAREVFDVVDAVGIERAMAGTGVAEG